MIKSIIQKPRARVRRNRIILYACLILILYVISEKENLFVKFRHIKRHRDTRPRFTNRSEIKKAIDKSLVETLMEEKGQGCVFPKLDPFDSNILQYYQNNVTKITCQGEDWVTCYLSQCSVKKKILDKYKNIVCYYNDIVHISDYKRQIGPRFVFEDPMKPITLNNSDHIKVFCTGNTKNDSTSHTWTGHAIGFRPVKLKPAPPYREKTYSIMILAFDSTSKNGFIRSMPKSFKVLKEELGATVLNGYNVLGDGTTAALIPLLTGRNELELADVRKGVTYNHHVDGLPFIFYALQNYGYRTAFFEDMPHLGSFNYRLRGFNQQPTDHYMRSFLLEETKATRRKAFSDDRQFCVGDTPQYKLILNISDQFFSLDGRKFCLTFISDITHDEYRLDTADDDVAHFLRSFKSQGRLKDTMLIVMGDHGVRMKPLIRRTYQGKLEERLPFLSIVLPDEMRKERFPGAGQLALEENKDALVTTYDLHTSILYLVGLSMNINSYVVNGSDYQRGLSLFKAIPKNRTCSDAGIEPQWCSCLIWIEVTENDRVYGKIVKKAIEYINLKTEPLRYMCKLRTLKKMHWMLRRSPNKRVLTFKKSMDQDGYVGLFENMTVRVYKQDYKLKLSLNPDGATYEIYLTYFSRKIEQTVVKGIKRIGRYRMPLCLRRKHPKLNIYCHCDGNFL